MTDETWLTTKEVLDARGISEATLRRWLKDGLPVPELRDAERDWKGWRRWQQRHVDAILEYQRSRQQAQGLMLAEQIPLFGQGPKRGRG